jgi:hypothetical protein
MKSRANALCMAFVPLGQHKCFSCTNALPGTNEMGTNDTEEGSALDKTKKKVGKVVTKKLPTLQCAKISLFMRHVYLPVLVKCRYHFAQ